MQITTRDGVQLYAKRWGSGRPVILIHGWPLTADTWDDVALPIAAAGFEVIAYDRRGFGRSEQPWTGYDYDTFADDLADVLTATNATQATLVGFSMGGGEVARYFQRHKGAHVAQAALIGSVVPYLLRSDDNPDGVAASVFETMQAQITKDRAAFYATFFKDFYGVGVISRPVSPEVIAWSQQLAMQAGLKATLDCITAFSQTDFRPDLAAISVPTLVIHGTGDAIVPIEPTARAVAAALPNAQVHEYDDAPHGLLASHKTQVTSDLLAFLQSYK